MEENFANWAGNITYEAARLHLPETVSELQEIVAKSRKVKALGTRHSFSGIADTAGDLVSTERLNRILDLDRNNRTVSVEAGIRYGELGCFLNDQGFALQNLASLPHISVAGACLTATHGSGSKNGNLATAVSALEFVDANGSVSRLHEGHQSFAGAVVSLGGLGIVTILTLRIVPTFTLRQDVYDDLPFEELERRFDEIMASAYSVSLFTDWQGAAIEQVWVKGFHDLGVSFFGARRAAANRHPIRSKSPVNCTEQRGISGPWHKRLPHFRLEYSPSSGEELQSEYFVPLERATEALSAVRKLAEILAPILQISEIRTIAADALWMSPCYERDSLAIHFTWKKNLERVREVLPRVEAQLRPFAVRPHWGKLFTMSIRGCYPRLPDFRALLRSRDPEGKFRNTFLDNVLQD